MDIVSLLTLAKEMGFETGQIMSMVVVYFFMKKEINKLIEAIKSLEDSHNQRLEVIETHVGLRNQGGKI